MVGLSETVIMTDTEQGTALLDERTGRYWVTNGTAALILRSIREHGSLERAVQDVCSAFPDLLGDDAERDVARLVDRMRQNGLLV